jgi:hypothetical protein
MVAISGRGTRVASNKSVFMFRSESIPGPRVLPIFHVILFCVWSVDILGRCVCKCFAFGLIVFGV